MGKRLKQQRRGKGSNAYTKPPHHFKADVLFGMPREGVVSGEVIELVDDPGHTAPLMRIRYDDRRERMLIAPEGIMVGSAIEEGSKASIKIGNIMPIGMLPDGIAIYNIEMTPNDGGKMVRSAGSYATIVAHHDDKVTIMLPSKQQIDLDANCRAEIGVVAGGGMEMQPIMKAGKNYYIKHAINAKWPTNRGVKSNPVDHPFGGKQHHKGASSMIGRGAPPGSKVGHIAARRVGRRKRG